ncbi:MAG: ribonuclease HII [Candidatus Aenigmarchaeota archaeon]|nr:ribonuclease HII [Candidatus Aenigmarchaeota archaeon]
MPEQIIISGIDEAGRGCILGPMVIAGVAIPHEHEEKLRKLGVKDSKQLSPQKREELAKKIEELAQIIVLEVAACKIDNYRKQGISLNRLEAIKFAEILNLQKPHKAYIDAPDRNLPKLHGYLKKMAPDGIELVVEHFADSKYPVVSAASIIAKVERDKKIDSLRKEYGDIGSGYTSDPVTVRWLEDWMKTHKELPECARKSWITAENLIEKKEQSRLSSFLGKLGSHAKEVG